MNSNANFGLQAENSRYNAPVYTEKPNSPNFHNNGETKSERMFKSNEWRDLWAAVLYYAHLGGVFVILGLNFNNLTSMKLSKGEASIGFQALGIIGVVALGAVGLTAIFLSLVSRYPTSVIKGTFISSVLLLGLMGLGMFFVPNGQLVGIIYLVMAGLNGLIYFLWRRRIPFSGTLLKSVIDIYKIYSSTWSLSALAIAGQVLFSSLYLTTFASIALKYSQNEVGSEDVSGGDIACILYLVFSLYWSMQVVENVIHTTVCGVVATYYFLYGSGAAILNPVWGSLKRSVTLSFGSIAFGSLIVAAIQFVRFLINSSRNDRDNLAAVCADCLLGMIEGLVRYFNYYAYVHVAIYGKPFIESGKDTWELIKSRGVDVIINDNLVGTCMGMGVLLISLICGLIGYLAGLALTRNDSAAIAIGIISLGFAAMISAVATQLVESGVSATLVCLAEDPAALQKTKPELYNEIITSYNQITF